MQCRFLSFAFLVINRKLSTVFIVVFVFYTILLRVYIYLKISNLRIVACWFALMFDAVVCGLFLQYV